MLLDAKGTNQEGKERSLGRRRAIAKEKGLRRRNSQSSEDEGAIKLVHEE